MRRTVKVTLTYRPDADDERAMGQYMASGLTQKESLAQVMQDVFGGLGAGVVDVEDPGK